MATDDRLLLESIATDMGGDAPQNMNDAELIDFICKGGKNGKQK